MTNPAKFFENTKNTILTKFGSNPAKMLIYTGVLGWFLSCAAQVGAIAFNDKIPKEKKLFLIPQEIGDGAINVLSFFFVTSAVKGFASNLVSTGKLANPKIRKFLAASGVNKVKNVLGQNKFNIEKMANFDKISKEYKSFKNGTDVIGMTLGSILSCNIITPILRNKFAAGRQQEMLARMKTVECASLKSPHGISMDTYRNLAAAKYSSNSLKI